MAVPLLDRWPLSTHHDLRDALLQAWNRPGYHDLQHLSEVLDRLDELGAHGVGFDHTLVRLAAWFHDAVYAGAADDEEQSALWAERDLPATYAGGVARLVRMTVDHTPDESDVDASALSDADLAILAAPSDRYDAYAGGVRHDFAHVSDADFRDGRRAVLSELVNRQRIFTTCPARELWEASARANLRRELSL